MLAVTGNAAVCEELKELSALRFAVAEYVLTAQVYGLVAHVLVSAAHVL
jgi:hypothetical protein